MLSTPTKFSLRTLLAIVVVFSVLFAFYTSFNLEASRQAALVAQLDERGGDYYEEYENEEYPKRLGHSLGFEYPADRVRIIKGPGRAAWGYFPGWKCTNDDLQMLRGFKNLEEIFIADSILTGNVFIEFTHSPRLHRIQFSGCDLSECDFTILLRVPALRRLDLAGSTVDIESLQAFMRDAPQCDVQGFAREPVSP